MLNLSCPRIVCFLGLASAYICKMGIDPIAEFVSVEQRPVVLRIILVSLNTYVSLVVKMK